VVLLFIEVILLWNALVGIAANMLVNKHNHVLIENRERHIPISSEVLQLSQFVSH
jgi:hypothetical protein